MKTRETWVRSCFFSNVTALLAGVSLAGALMFEAHGADPNKAPIIADLDGDSVNYLEGAGVVLLDQGAPATVTDLDSLNFASGTLTISIASGKDAAEDSLGIKHQGSGAGQIGVIKSTVTFGGKAIGTFTGGTAGNNLVVTFNTASSPTSAQALIRSITYKNSDANQPTAGARAIRFVLTDGDGETSEDADVTVTVGTINDAPSFAKGANVTVLEGSGAASIANWATKITAGTGETSQQVQFTVSNNHNSPFSVQPDISPSGTLTFTPASEANGLAIVTATLKDDGGTANGGKDSSPPQTFIIAVKAVNDVPSFTKGADQTVLEDAGKQTVAGWAKEISPGPANEASQKVDFQVSNSNPKLFSLQPAIAPNGTLTYAPAPNANGSATVAVRIHDNGGTIKAGTTTIGANTSEAQTFSVTVTPVNDAPSFVKGANLSVLEEAGAQTVANWASKISAGPPDESGQALNFVVSNNNTALFSVQPAISSTGTLIFTPATPNINGVAVVTAQLKDDGGTENGGKDAGPTLTFVIAIKAVNDLPSFTKGPDQTVFENAGKQTVVEWAKDISAGPANEVSQKVNFLVSNDNPRLFSLQPAVAPNGTLTYAPAPNANGKATVTVRIRDSGGTFKNGTGTLGSDTSDGQTFTITVTGLNNAPSFVKGANVAVLEDAGPQSVANWATKISAGAADESSQVLDFIVSNNKEALFAVPPAISASGTLSFTPASNANGVALVTVQLHDNGGTDNGGKDTSAAQTFVIVIKPVNDAPSFELSSETVTPTTDLVSSIPGFAKNISKGPADEAAQTAVFSATPSDRTFFAIPPVISPTGTLTFKTVPNASGSVSVSVTLKDSGGTANGGKDTSEAQTFTITRNVPSISIGDATVTEGNSGTVNATFIVTLSTASTQPVSIKFATVNGTAAAGSDFTAVSGTLTFAAGEVSKSIAVVISGDTHNETDETFSVVLADPANATITQRTGLGNIVNDDSPASAPQLGALPDLRLDPNTMLHPGPADLRSYILNPDSNIAQMQFRIANLNEVNTAFGLSDGKNGGGVGFPVATIGMDPDSGTFKVRPGGVAQDNTIHVHPVQNFAGAVSVTIEARDAVGNVSNQRSFLVTIAAAPSGDTPPTISDIPDQIMDEDTVSAPIPFSITAPGSSVLTITFNSSDQTLLPNDKILLEGSGSNYTLAAAPRPNQHGVTLMTVNVSNGNATASKNFRLTVRPVNDPPTLTYVQVLGGASEDTPFEISFANLSERSDAADIDGDALSFRIEDLTRGTLTKNGTPVTPQSTLLSSGEKLIWTPPANISGNITAFAISASDGKVTSAPVHVTVAVAPVNDAPTLTSISPLNGASEDIPFYITYEMLAGASDVADAESTPFFRIQSVTSGTLTQDGTPVAPGTLLHPGERVVWTAAVNENGTRDAFVVRAHDGLLPSENAVQVRVNVSPQLDRPTLTRVNVLGGASEDTAIPITHATLLAESDASDPDGDSISFLITVMSGTLLKDNVAVTSTTLRSGETIVWTPPANLNGIRDAFRVEASDGTQTSGSTVPVQINVAPVNDPPTISSRMALSNATEDSSYGIPYSALQFATLYSDVDGPTLLFQIDSVINGTLTKNGVAVVPGTTLVGTDESLAWTPAANANGTLSAFSVRAFDGTSASADAAQIQVNVGAVNDAPVNSLPLVPIPSFAAKWGSGGSADGQFNRPIGIAIDPSDQIYVVDEQNHRIQKFDSAGNFIGKWGSQGSGDGQFSYPRGIAVSGSSEVYVADKSNFRIQRFGNSGAFINKWGSFGTDDGQFRQPTGIVVNGLGDLYVADNSNDRVQRFSSSGVFITKWGSFGSSDGQFYSPNGLAADSSGNIYVPDAGNHRIQKFTSSGDFITKWGSQGTGEGQLNSPIGVAVDSADGVYVVDYGNHRMQKFTTSGSFVAVWGSLGSGDGQFSSPIGVAIDTSGNIYVADTGNNRIQKFKPNSAAPQTTLEETALVFHSLNGNAISVSDIDVPNWDFIQVTLSVQRGLLELPNRTGLSFQFSDPDGTGFGGGGYYSTMTFRGTLDLINSALNGMRYYPNYNFAGNDTLTITTKDLNSRGFQGTGGTLTDTDTVNIQVIPVNDAPAGADKSVTIQQDTAYTFAAADFGFTDLSDIPSNNFLAVRIAALPQSGKLTLNSTTVNAGESVTVSSMIPDTTWKARDQNRAWYSIASSSDGTKVVAIASGDKIYTSTDSGASWTPRENIRSWRGVASSSDGLKLVAVASGERIYTSTDSGVTWTARDEARGWGSVASSADGTKLVAAVGGGGQIYTSSDSGVNWTARDSGRNWNSVASSADGTKLMAVEWTGKVYISADSGLNWTPTQLDRTWISVACSADGNKIVALTYGLGIVFTSTDAGATWSWRASFNEGRCVASSTDGTKLVVATGRGHIYRSVDSGANWTVHESLREWRSVACSADGNKVFAGVENGQIYTWNAYPGLVFAPEAAATGSPYTSFTFQVQDDGGTANGGVNLDPTPNIMTINVTAVSPQSMTRSGLLKMRAPRIFKGTLHFEVETARENIYVLEYKDSLADADWKPLLTFAGNGSTQSLTDLPSQQGQRFYRVRQIGRKTPLPTQ